MDNTCWLGGRREKAPIRSHHLSSFRWQENMDEEVWAAILGRIVVVKSPFLKLSFLRFQLSIKKFGSRICFNSAELSCHDVKHVQIAKH